MGYADSAEAHSLQATGAERAAAGVPRDEPVRGSQASTSAEQQARIHELRRRLPKGIHHRVKGGGAPSCTEGTMRRPPLTRDPLAGAPRMTRLDLCMRSVLSAALVDSSAVSACPVMQRRAARKVVWPVSDTSELPEPLLSALAD